MNKLYWKHYATVKRELRKRGCSSFNFDDIYQEAIICLWVNERNDNNSINNIRNYLIQVCKNIWLKERKRQQLYVKLEDSEYIRVQEPEPDTNEARTSLLLKHLNNLSSTCREILTLYSKGYNEDKIGSIMKLGGRRGSSRKGKTRQSGTG